ncbi:MAG: hypothetical protein HFH67_04610 [Lachnospiraceae bacterium]|nr:hypothetical protein [Lachnospiraceae bacterium]
MESKNKKPDNKEKKYYRKTSHCIIIIQSCFLVLLYFIGIYRYFCTGYAGIILAALFLVSGKINTKYYT